MLLINSDKNEMRPPFARAAFEQMLNMISDKYQLSIQPNINYNFRQILMINLDKYEMRPLLAGATFPSVNPGPAAVAAWADHILKPGKQKCYHLSYTII